MGKLFTGSPPTAVNTVIAYHFEISIRNVLNPCFNELHSHESELIQLAEELDAEFEAVKRASKLDQYYSPTRNPNSLPGDVPSRV